MIDEHYRTKREMVYYSLKTDILKGVIKPGTRLLVSDTAKKYNVSIIPVREAFASLEKDQLLEPYGSVGMKVSGLSISDVEKIFQIRIELESLAVKLAVDNISNKQIDSLKKMVDNSSLLVDQMDFNGYFEENRHFHFSIYSISENERLIDIIYSLYENSRRYPNWYTCKEQMEKSLSEHRLLIDYLMARDADRAVGLIRKHTEDSLNHIVERMKQENYEK